MADKLPALQFYPADWRKDIAVQSLSLEDRAIWFEMLCIMHDCEERGKLIINGQPMKDETVAKMIGITLKKYRNSLVKMKSLNVFGEQDGVIFNRRMVRDEYIRNVRKTAGSQGGNPNLVRNLVNQNDNQSINQNDKQNPTPSSSSSISSSYKNNERELTPPKPPVQNLQFDFLDKPENVKLKDVFRKYYQYRVKEKKKGFKTQDTLETAFEYLKKISSGDRAKADEIVTKCIANGWQGLQPINDDNNSRKNQTVEGRGVQTGRENTFGNDTGLAGKGNGRGRNYLDTGHGNPPRRDYKIFDFSKGVPPDSPDA